MTAPQWEMPPPPPSAPYADRGMVPQPRSGPYPDSWVVLQTTTNFPLTEDLSANVAGRASRRLKRSMHGEGKTDRIAPSKKPNKITVTELGEIDPHCTGKNAWDASVRVYVPRILDMSIIDFEKQKAQSILKLREALDNNFEYMEQNLSTLGFRNAIKRYLKTERSRLKAHFLLNGEDECPSHVNQDQWERLVDYWGTEKQLKKATTMAHARRQVKNHSSVGRKGKAVKDSQMVSVWSVHHFLFSIIPLYPIPNVN